MLVFSRKDNEGIVVGDNVRITVEQVRKEHVRFKVEMDGSPNRFCELRKVQQFILEEKITVLLVEIRGNRARIGIAAPTDCSVHRREVYETILRERQEAEQKVDANLDYVS